MTAVAPCLAITVAPCPLLDLVAFTTSFPAPSGELRSPDSLLAFLDLEAPAPVSRSEPIRKAVRDLLRTRAFKPTGRNKPASEYLVKAVEQAIVGPINPAVDTCNVVSLHSGLPISVVDQDLLSPPLSVQVAGEDMEYVFNASGQVLRLDGLLCLMDGTGPCASPIKDSQGTKVVDTSRRTLSLVWGTTAFLEQTACAVVWYRELLESQGARTETALLRPG